jgi:hypothetical protein
LHYGRSFGELHPSTSELEWIVDAYNLAGGLSSEPDVPKREC